jgi:hypothetical protein
MKIKKIDEDEVYKRTTTNHTFKVGKEGKSVQVLEYQTSEVDEIDNDSPFINEDDLAKLTDEEQEIFGENLGDFMDLEIGEEVDIDYN